MLFLHLTVYSKTIVVVVNNYYNCEDFNILLFFPFDIGIKSFLELKHNYSWCNENVDNDYLNKFNFVNNYLLNNDELNKILDDPMYIFNSKFYTTSEMERNTVYPETIEEYAKYLRPTWYGVSFYGNNTNNTIVNSMGMEVENMNGEKEIQTIKKLSEEYINSIYDKLQKFKETLYSIKEYQSRIQSLSQKYSHLRNNLTNNDFKYESNLKKKRVVKELEVAIAGVVIAGLSFVGSTATNLWQADLTYNQTDYWSLRKFKKNENQTDFWNLRNKNQTDYQGVRNKQTQYNLANFDFNIQDYIIL
ncbi:hypothetical protein H8356DRAFT_1323643 [Neocallimastix lanati (nom. inval.)]|nr:hypothetical protein H8356DRAFT_1323643 [Neocallimastix sp. JGI-2020a]